MKRYIGIAGIERAGQIDEVLRAIAAPPALVERLAFGVLMTDTTRCGRPKTRQPNRYPSRVTFPQIFVVAPSLGRPECLLHYATENLHALRDELVDLGRMAGVWCAGLQLNLPWPPVEQLVRAPHWSRFVLQIGRRALAETPKPDDVVFALEHYLRGGPDDLTDVLLDPSGGEGRPVEVEAFAPFVRAIRAAFPTLGVGIAGKLSAERLGDPALSALVLEHGLSIDVETGVRDEDDRLAIPRVQAFVEAARPLFPEVA